MSKETVRKIEKPKLKLASAMTTTWAIGTGAWSGVALSQAKHSQPKADILLDHHCCREASPKRSFSSFLLHIYA